MLSSICGQNNLLMCIWVHFPYLSVIKVDGISLDMLQFPADFTCLALYIEFAMPRLDSKQRLSFSFLNIFADNVQFFFNELLRFGQSTIHI